MNPLPHDIYGIEPYSFTLWDHPLLMLMILVFIFLLLALCFILYRKHKKKKALTLAIPVDPLKVLDQKLKAIDPRLATSFDGKKFFYEFSWIIREVIEETCGIKATDLTTKELKMVLSNVIDYRLGQQATVKMMCFFERSDLIKFADETTDLEEAKKNYNELSDLAFKLIEKRAVDPVL